MRRVGLGSSDQQMLERIECKFIHTAFVEAKPEYVAGHDKDPATQAISGARAGGRWVLPLKENNLLQ
jgi:hypothetical protein